MTRKIALIENEETEAFLNAATSQVNQVRTFLMLYYGIHPANLRKFTTGDRGNVSEKGIIEFKRVKNRKARRELLGKDQAKVIYKVAKRGKLKITNRAYELICEEQGKSLLDYRTPPVSPMTLRHTFVLNMMREKNFDLDLVAVKAGCNIITVQVNYLDLEQWEKISKKEFRAPLDLTDFKFMED